MMVVIAKLCIYIFTWNVGSQYSEDVSLTDALALNGSSPCPNQQLPDIYLLAFQETNIKLKSQIFDIIVDNPWTLKAKQYLDEHHYVKVATKQLQGLLIMLFAQAVHMPQIKDIETQSTRTGIGGLWGNKGAVSIRMNLYETGVTFVNAHLAAHDHELKERIEDYNQIIHNHNYKVADYHAILDHDVAFWFGDLNFRLSGDDTAWDIQMQVEHGNLSVLLQRDQLLLVRETGYAFEPFRENSPTFPPTYKYTKGTSKYNLKRRPAWCDRILFRFKKNKRPGIQLNIEQLSYRSHPVYTLSDHKPVSGAFLYQVKRMSPTNKRHHQ